MRRKSLWYVLGVLILSFILVAQLGYARRRFRKRRAGGVAKSQMVQDALKVYVPPGDHDQYYAFLSGGHSGHIYVYGVPSLRHIRTIPVFGYYPPVGWGIDEHSKKMLKGLIFGDTHHPGLSETNGDYDGQFLFINDNMNARVAMIDLKSFRPVDILGPVPNLEGNHASVYPTPNTEYIWMATRFSVPIPRGTVADVTEYKTKYKGVITAVKVDRKNKKLKIAWQILMPPWDYDLADSGKKVSYGWVFFTTYNTEAEFIEGKPLEVTASQRDMDYIIAVNWKGIEKEIAKGNYKIIDGVKVFDPVKTPGYVFALPCKKSPHGVDVTPDGEYIIGNGKLAPVVNVFSFRKMIQCIKNKDFAGKDMGIPVLPREKVLEAEVPVGLGPLHTVFDDKGYAYTSLFVESAVAKWSWKAEPRWKLVDKVPIQYNIGHIAAPHGDTVNPRGKWVLALNKLSKGQHLKVGPDLPECLQLIDITGPKMRVIYEAYPEPEPHYAMVAEAKVIEPNVREVYVRPDRARPGDLVNNDPNAIWDPRKARCERRGNTVECWMTEIRSTIMPNVIRAKKGDTVILHLTNIEEMRDELHGFAICEHNVSGVPAPGETMTFKFKADKVGVYPFYCTNFCSALHQEMQGYLIVSP